MQPNSVLIHEIDGIIKNYPKVAIQWRLIP